MTVSIARPLPSLLLILAGGGLLAGCGSDSSGGVDTACAGCEVDAATTGQGASGGAASSGGAGTGGTPFNGGTGASGAVSATGGGGGTAGRDAGPVGGSSNGGIGGIGGSSGGTAGAAAGGADAGPVCVPDCANRCAGVDDGCGGLCPSGGCDGCCDANRGCVAATSQSNATCGAAGERCASCTERGETCQTTPSVCASSLTHEAQVIRVDMPQSLDPGQSYTVTIEVRNTGTATWTAAGGYKLGSQNPPNNATWGASRSDLGAADSVAPGQSALFSFSVTAPSVPGIYGFQWRMLQEGVEWFGAHSTYLPVAVGNIPRTVCEAARALVDADTNATPTLQGCIDATPAGQVLELPAGRYRVDGRLQIVNAGITLRTEGKTLLSAPCAIDAHDCAELQPSTSFTDTVGVLQVLHDGSRVDHLVIDGNKTTRSSTPSGTECAAYSNSYGYNMRVMCSDCMVTNSVSKNALCGTALEVAGVGSDVVVWRNSFVDNGVHDRAGLWADGVTVHDYANSTFVANHFRDNTDIDFIFGGCAGCIIQDNTIDHTASFAGGAFAGLMLHAWPSGATSGNFTGADTSRNRVDCGPSRRCGFGLYIGPDAWYDADTFGGAVHHNVVLNAEQGVLIDDAHDMSVYNNHVTNPGTSTRASCGTRSTTAYGMGNTSANIDTSRDTMGTSYASMNWDGCIPNWWQP